MSNMTSEQFNDRLDELTEYYNTHDDIANGKFLTDKKYWYIYMDFIAYGHISPHPNHHGTTDGSCEKRISYYDDVVFTCFKSRRHVPRNKIADNKKAILKIYIEHLKLKNSPKLKYLNKTYPEYVV